MYKGSMVGYLPDSKGWFFWFPDAKDFVNLALTCWLDLENKNLFPILDTSIPEELKYQSIVPDVPLPNIKREEEQKKFKL